MNGAHDLGGMMGFGPVAPEQDEPVFHAPWERRVLAMEIAMRNAGVPWNLDMIRSVRENLPPPTYLAMSYYEIWLHSQVELLAKYGFIAKEELSAGHALREARPTERVLHADGAWAAATRPGSYLRAAPAPARFAVGDRVRTLNINPTGHTRLPRYARARAGTIGRVHGPHVYPDTNATGHGEDPRWCYSVTFTGRELWGTDADPTLTVALDLWEPYLEPT
jgi:nitrile hydratase